MKLQLDCSYGDCFDYRYINLRLVMKSGRNMKFIKPFPAIYCKIIRIWHYRNQCYIGTRINSVQDSQLGATKCSLYLLRIKLLLYVVQIRNYTAAYKI